MKERERESQSDLLEGERDRAEQRPFVRSSLRCLWSPPREELTPVKYPCRRCLSVGVMPGEGLNGSEFTLSRPGSLEEGEMPGRLRRDSARLRISQDSGGSCRCLCGPRLRCPSSLQQSRAREEARVVGSELAKSIDPGGKPGAWLRYTGRAKSVREVEDMG